MLTVYPACFIKESEGGYSVIFPDLNNLATCGDDIEEAMAMAIDCLAGYVKWEEEDGNALPVPSKQNKLLIESTAKEMELDDYDAEGSFVSLVSVDVKEYARKHFDKAVRKSVTIPSWLNDEAMARGINFSLVLKEALLEKVKA